jgi:hypothetical protein
MRRELARKATELMTFFAAVNALPKPESRKFPVFSLPNREFWASRDEFAADSLLQRRVNKLSFPLAFSARVTPTDHAARYYKFERPRSFIGPATPGTAGPRAVVQMIRLCLQQLRASAIARHGLHKSPLREMD